MAKRVSDAEWSGDLKDGAGTLRLGSGAFEGRYSFKSRFEDGPGTNPEELIAAAHAACFSMALSAALSQKGHAPTRILTKAIVHFGPVNGRFCDLPRSARNRRPSSRHRRCHIRAGCSDGQSGMPRLQGPRGGGRQSGGEASIAVRGPAPSAR
jgi:hypothetical protein